MKTQEEILQYNKRCAEFLGWEYDKEYDEYEPTDYKFGSAKWLSDMYFHLDWNWIMEVVEAIEKIDNVFVKIHTGGTFIHPINDTKNYISKEYSPSKKEAVVQAINEFLIWYNEKEKENKN